MKLVLKSYKNTHFATAYYDGNILTVLAGSKINMNLTYDTMSKSVLKLREDTEIVSPQGIVLRDVSFNSPTAAAHFVTGRSVNGYIVWRVDDKINLKEHLKKQLEE